jgi:hypothetical protein
MSVPENLRYEMWPASTPTSTTPARVHPQIGYDGPLAAANSLACMITGWGAHHVDSAHWGMGTELTGPVEISGWGQSQKGLWDVHVVSKRKRFMKTVFA